MEDKKDYRITKIEKQIENHLMKINELKKRKRDIEKIKALDKKRAELLDQFNQRYEPIKLIDDVKGGNNNEK